MTPDERRAWRRRVFGAADLTTAHKVVLLALETFADYRSGADARPGVAVLAEMCGLGISAVEKALRQGRELGFIEQTLRANPKRGLAASYQLLSTRTDVRTEIVSTRTSERVEETFNPYESAFQPVREGVSTRTCVQPPLSRTPLHNTEEGLRPSGTSPDVPPAGPPSPQLQQSANSKRPRCARHAHITDDSKVPPCPDCKRLRQEAEEMDKAERELERARRAAEYERIQRCPDCRGGHWVLEQDGVPADPAVRCAHPRLTAAAQ